MRPFKEYDKSFLEEKVKTCKSLRQFAKEIGVSGANTAKSILLRYNIDFSHFTWNTIYENLVGKKFNLLTIISTYKQSDRSGKKANRVWAHCQCDCGKKKSLRIDQVCTGVTPSCGCLSHNRWDMVSGKNPAFTGKGDIRGAKIAEIKRSAKKRGYEFNISKEFLWELYLSQNKKCALTGLDIWFGRIHFPNETTASLDRIDNDKGYVYGNVRWVLKDINMIRGSYNDEYFIKLCNAVAKTHPE